ncbi:type II toxin-antitoxin system toxin DNA ADP-ribosyl transferase DarT [Ralstonia pseudosolanacearum]|uniref:type II toxin-antitoxin system toxin DNA ADP-ribosyl transferase DarT n=1 Tax=Ralstonia solanacearum species complex bacterium KE056 TaxID=3119585 RepID=UPI002FC3AF15
MAVPANPKIYHIVHVDRLASIIASKALWCDGRVIRQGTEGTTIGMSNIKKRRLDELTLDSHPNLYIGECVPFYFCPRSVMLFLIHKRNPELAYKGGQEPIVHLEAELNEAVEWAEEYDKRWAFTLSNAGSSYFEDRCSLDDLDQINWGAVHARDWRGDLKEGKQAEFLVENCFPWKLVRRIGVHSEQVYRQVLNLLPEDGHRPIVEVKRDWYYN